MVRHIWSIAIECAYRWRRFRRQKALSDRLFGKPPAVKTESLRSDADPRFGYLTYQCNICGRACECPIGALQREGPSCSHCGSTVRMRAIIHLLSLELFGESRTLPDFPIRPAIKGIGLSDWRGYAIPLAHKLGYQNTFYHKKPRLDITRVDSAWEAQFDFVIASDVFEHVAPPVSAAFANARRLLKPNGVLIFTVPYTLKDGPTLEHFPGLYDYRLIRTGTGFRLHNRTQAGDEQVFDQLVFHGGAGETLEMRVFTLTALQREFQKAGFTRVKVHCEPEFKFGIYWRVDWSLPITARAVGPIPRG